MEKVWQIAPRVEPDLIRQLLRNRGLVNDLEIETFLRPDWSMAIDPHEFTQMKAAVTRVFQALKQSEKIVIHGDYDADGTCGSALLFGAIHEIQPNAQLSVYLPDRERDGYGVALHTVERLAREGTKLLITVDCGIANDVSLGRAQELGLDVIICDHHQLGEKLPEGAIILHPGAPGETYANKHLCGTGVAFKLASALIREARERGANFPEGYEKWFLDLVAVATVTDVMPLVGENRTLELFGLKVLNKTRRPGLQKIIEYCRSPLGELETEAIGFQIGPRINAAGRMKSASIAFKAITANNSEEADALALELEQLNRDRQRVSDAAYAEAKVMIAGRPAEAKIHVVWSENWLPGIVGLVAGKITNQFGVPSFALTKVGEHYVGSGRSVGGFHLVEAMRACGDIFVKAGGHPEACGLTLASLQAVERFHELISHQADAYFADRSQAQALAIEAELPLEAIDWDLYDQIKSFEPFGQKNPKPIFCAHGLVVSQVKTMGSTGAHLRLTVQTARGERQLIGFGSGYLASSLTVGSVVDVAYQIEINEWNGRRELQPRLVDIHLKK
jgi:single-stranded-DNA-specific exonuclease